MKIYLLFFIFIIIYLPAILLSVKFISNYVLKIKSRDHLERLVFIHNDIFLKFADSDEKNDALEKLEVIARTLGTSLENYKSKKINASELSHQFNLYEKNFDNLTTEYPWILRFDLHDGMSFNYKANRKLVKKMRKLEKKY